VIAPPAGIFESVSSDMGETAMAKKKAGATIDDAAIQRIADQLHAEYAARPAEPGDATRGVAGDLIPTAQRWAAIVRDVLEKLKAAGLI